MAIGNTKWQRVPKVGQCNLLKLLQVELDVKFTDAKVLHRVLPRLAYIKIVFDLGADSSRLSRPVRTFNVGSVCKGELSKTYFADLSDASRSCGKIDEAQLP